MKENNFWGIKIRGSRPDYLGFEILNITRHGNTSGMAEEDLRKPASL